MLLSKVLLDGIVHALDDHVLKPRPLQQVGHRWGVAERIHRPTGTGLHTWTEGGVYHGGALATGSSATPTEVSLQPLVSLHQLVQHGKVMRVGFIGHHPPACHHLQLPRLQQADQSQRRNRTPKRLTSTTTRRRTMEGKCWIHLLTIARFCSSMLSHHLEKKLISAQIIFLLTNRLTSRQRAGSK